MLRYPWVIIQRLNRIFSFHNTILDRLAFCFIVDIIWSLKFEARLIIILLFHRLLITALPNINRISSINFALNTP